ncbi:MAG: hypothetical protein VKJ86_07230, partial [Synechococcus sp.]|nr:hypothetical protein [Synechococcus sp.]
NGEITINVASTFTANTTAGEDNEFAAGLYSTGYLLEAAPFGGGTTASVGTEISNTISPSCFLDAGFRDTPTPYTATGSPPNVTLLQATDSAIFDCNATTVDITFTDTANYTAPTGGGASNLTAQHKFQYQLNESGSFTDYPVGLSISNSNTDANGDMKVEVRSTWTPDADKLFASEYTAETTVTVTAK